MNPVITLTETPTEAAVASIRAHLNRHNQARSGVRPDYRPLAILLTDPETGEVIGGLWGWTYYSVLFTDLLFIPDSLRGHGLGAKLLAQAEQEALARGCHTAWLDTFSFQAPEYYQRHGYVVFGSFDDHPSGHTRFFLKKPLN